MAFLGQKTGYVTVMCEKKLRGTGGKISCAEPF